MKTGVCGGLGSGDRTRRQKITHRAISLGVRAGTRGGRQEGQAEGCRLLMAVCFWSALEIKRKEDFCNGGAG